MSRRVIGTGRLRRYVEVTAKASPNGANSCTGLLRQFRVVLYNLLQSLAPFHSGCSRVHILLLEDGVVFTKLNNQVVRMVGDCHIPVSAALCFHLGDKL
jgi:hypothetical protein